MGHQTDVCKNALRSVIIFTFTIVFSFWWIITGGHIHRFLSLHRWSRPCGLERDTETLKLPWRRASAKCLKCKITVLPSLMSSGYSGVWRRTVTQTVWGDDICPVRADRVGKKNEESWSFWMQHRKILCYNWRERKMGGETYGLSQR